MATVLSIPKGWPRMGIPPCSTWTRNSLCLLSGGIPGTYCGFLRGTGHSSGVVLGAVAQCLCVQYGQLPGLCGRCAGFCPGPRYGLLGFLFVSETQGYGPGRRGFLRCPSPQRNRSRKIHRSPVGCDRPGYSGEDVSALFCDTVEEKLTHFADNTIFMADAYHPS